MVKQIVDVLRDGTICLGSSVTCDGFAEGFPIRVQTHVHDDHMIKFETSKGLQDLVMRPETYSLLVAEKNADLEYRDNFHRLGCGKKFELEDGSHLCLLPSSHMLGSCQVTLQRTDGLRIGYSGDFGWPLGKVIEVDQLVVDSTYGSPRSVRHYTQAAAEECLSSLVFGQLRQGPVHIYAHRGTIERVLHVLSDNIGVPIIATARLIKEVEVYQDYGLAAGELLWADSEVGQLAMQEKSFVHLYSKGDGFRNEPMDGTSITCSAYMVPSNNPLLQYSDRAYRVSLSNHADFNETLAYIKATGAKKVVTDNTRNHGCELALAINQRLEGVFASPSSNKRAPC